jgi:hypothetical protein
MGLIALATSCAGTRVRVDAVADVFDQDGRLTLEIDRLPEEQKAEVRIVGCRLCVALSNLRDTTLPHELVMRSLRTFAEMVMPPLRRLS